jgi:hypothetical protein
MNILLADEYMTNERSYIDSSVLRGTDKYKWLCSSVPRYRQTYRGQDRDHIT